MTINSEKLRTPYSIFLIYVVIFSLFIMAFRFIFPGSQAPLEIYAGNWRLIQGFLEIFNWFPALALSALVIPFGLASFEENYQSFSQVLLKKLITSVITAICAAVVYGIIFFLAQPMLKNHENNLRFTGALYQLAKQNAYDSADQGEWFEAKQFLGICDRIWIENPELSGLRDRIAIGIEKQAMEESAEIDLARSALAPEIRSVDILPLSENERPVNATQAIEMSRTAFDDQRYFDAHWLANLGQRLSPRGSVQAANAAQLASEAWNMIASQAPNHRETRLVELYNLKVSGYQAMASEDWILAYYIFQELLESTPDDPDAKNYYAASEIAAREKAFFLDEMELSVGEILNGPVFSLLGADGRVVLRFSSLTLSADSAYGFGLDYMEFDKEMNLIANGTARYVKVIPVILNDAPQVLIMTHALDRYDKNHNYRSEWFIGSEPAGGIVLNVKFEDFLLLSGVRRGLSNLQIIELYNASKKLGDSGYIKQIFEAEILNRLGSALFFLPAAVFVIIIAWRYRAREKPRYLFILLLPVLPVVFHGFVYLYRVVFNTLGVWLVLTAGFTAAIIVFLVTLAVTLLISLIALSAQHS